MKILVFSDSHHSLAGMYHAIELHSPQQVIHLGDFMDDAEEVALAYPKLPFCMVPGNCDGWTMMPAKKQITLDGVSILLAHGDLWRVKQNYYAAYADARACGAQILLFGHTHKALCEQLEDGLWVMNPGMSRSTYGLIELNDGKILCSVLPQN